MAETPTAESRVLDEKGVQRLGLAAGLGFAGAVGTIVLPLAFVVVVADYPGGFFTFNSPFVEAVSISVLAGAILLLLSLFVYRRGFAALRKVDARFYGASVLCIVGSFGFLLLLISAALVAGNTTSLLSCVHGHPTHALSCLESGQPLGAATGVIGFLLGWVGGVGIMIGLLLSGGRFRARSLSAGGVVYGLLLLVLIAPFVELFVAIPGVSYILIVGPLLAVVGPALALKGSLGATRRFTGA